MEFIDVVKGRRAIRKFDPNHEITDIEVEKLMSSVIQSPTAFNTQNWRFLLVRGSELREKMKAAAWNQNQVTDSSMMVVVCGDREAWNKNPERYYKNSTEVVRDKKINLLTNYYTKHVDARRDEAFRSGGMAAMTLMLAAVDMGYDTCPMTGFEFDEMAEVVDLPEDFEIVMMVAVGKIVEKPLEKPGQLDLSDVVFFERFHR